MEHEAFLIGMHLHEFTIAYLSDLLDISNSITQAEPWGISLVRD